MHVFGASVALLSLFWHFIYCVLVMVNYVHYVKRIELHWIQLIKLPYLVFAIVGIVVFAVFSGPLYIYAYKYGKTHRKRVTRWQMGVALVFLFSTTPSFIIILYVFLSYGSLQDPLNGIVFVLGAISMLFGAAISWFAYMGTVAKAWHKRRGPERQIVDDAQGVSGGAPELIFAAPVPGEPNII